MFGGGNKIRVSDSVLRKVRVAAEISGLTVENFIERSLEREAERALSLMSVRGPSDRGEKQPAQAGLSEATFVE